MKSVRARRAWAALVLAGLGACADEDRGHDAVQLSLEKRAGDINEGCPGAELEEPLVSIRLAAADADGRTDVDVGPGVDLEVAIANTGDVSADVTVGGRFWGDGGRGRIEVGLGEIERRSSVTLPIDPAVLGLPVTEHDTSGSLLLWAEAVLPDGRHESSRTLPLAFHPVDGGWRIYDVETRETTYGGGALSDDARARREAAIERAAPGVRMGGVGLGTIVRSSDSPEDDPPEDGPADPDRGGAP